MKRLGLAVVLFAACAGTPLPPPELPPPTDIERLVGPPPPKPELTGLPDGRDTPVTNGQCKGLPAGIWVSERRFAERIATVVARDRCAAELAVHRRLRAEERAAFVELESAWQKRALDADARADRRLWLGIVIGAGAALLGVWSAEHLR